MSYNENLLFNMKGVKMKEETKQKLDEVKEFVYDHKSIIENGLWLAGCFVL